MKQFGPHIILDENEEWGQWVDQRRQYLDGLIDKWMFLLEGTREQKLPPVDKKLYPTLAILFENQMMYTMRERARLREATTTTDVTLPVRYALPLIRRVYPNLVATKICSVQPMPLSSGGTMQIFWQDFHREDAGNSSLVVPDSPYALRGENEVPKRIKMSIVSQSVTAEKRILMATWSTEVEEDAMGALQIDVEAELVQQAALEIQRELDQIMLNEMLLWASAGNVNWAWTIGAGHTAREWYETLGHAFIDMDNLLYGTRYVRGQWIVAGRRVVSFIRKMQTFQPEPNTDPNDPFKVGVQLVGRIEGFWDVYLTSHINQDRAIMGVYPTSQINAAYVFAPYVPLMAMPKVYAEAKAYDDATMPGAYVNVDKWTRNVRTRYAKRLVVPELLATLSISA